MPPVCKKVRGYASVKRKRKKRTPFSTRTSHYDHSYCKSVESENTAQREQSNSINKTTDNEESFNSVEILHSSTPYSAPVRRRLVMEGAISERSNTDNIGEENCVEELQPLENISINSLMEDCHDGVPIPHQVVGRRIVDFGSFFDQIKQIDSHNKVMGCSMSNCYIKSELCLGLRSRFVLKCTMFNEEFALHTENKEDIPTMDVNTASVAGSMAIGIGHSQLQELLSTMEIPTMSASTYSNYHAKLAKGWEETALDEMKAAAVEEIERAVAEGQVTTDGTPILTVVADGSWAKRSYRTNYNSLSGVAAIVGFHTKKVIFLGVRNKYCTVCARAAKTASSPFKHACFKNWTGSSSGMETDIILEGFSRSMEMYGAMYGKVLADGDSSVYATLYESRPYPQLTIEKIECTNHLLRNFCTKLKEISSKSNRPKPLRTIVQNNILRLRTAVTKAIEHRKKNDTNDQVSKLMTDIINSPSHVFGEHLKCSEIGYFCKGPKDKEKNYVPELKEAGMYSEVMTVVGGLADNSRSLLLKLNNNPAEHYNSIVAKFIGGKRVNFALRQSYSARCYAAVVSHNSRLPLYRLHKSMYSRSPGKILKKHELKRKRLTEKRALRRKNQIRKRRKILVASKEEAKHYGAAAMKPDMPEETFRLKKEMFLRSLTRTEEERKKLERGTLLQAGSGIWKEERRKLLTASNFGSICKRRKNTSCEGLVRSLLYRDVQTQSMLYGNNNESRALIEYQEETGLAAMKCGLFIDKDIPYLGATPDGLIGEDSVVEVKCPASCKQLTPEEGILTRKFTFWEISKDKSKVGQVNKNHNYYFQIQGQLHITQRQYCHFVMWTPLGKKIEIIERDDVFWDHLMREKLKMFYMDCLLPELVDPRQSRSMPIRNPDYIIHAMEESKRDKVKKTNE